MSKVFRILLVDDDSDQLDLFSELLRSHGYHVRVASTGREGLQTTREMLPDLVLLDVRLPDLSGFEVCRLIKADTGLKDVFVVLFSGSEVSGASQVGGLETGADDYLVKGMDMGALLARIRTTLRLQETTKALRTSEERFRELAENISEVFWMTNPAMDEMLYISPAYESIWGQTCESLYLAPGNWLQSIHPADRERLKEATPARQISGDYDEQYRIILPDGSVRWIQDRAFPIRDEAGKVHRIAGIAEDITKRKQAEAALRESEARQSAIMHAALDGIITFDHAGRIIDLNPAANKMLGCARSNALGQDICEVLVPVSLRHWFRAGLAHSFAIDEGPALGARIEMKGLRSDGTEFPIECTITPIKLVGPPMFTAFIRDISRQKQAEAQMSMLAHAVESTGEPICITDLQDRFIFVNQAFQKTYGHAKREILGQSPELLLSSRNPPALMRQILEQSRLDGWRGEIVGRKKDGTESPVFLITSKITEPSGKVIGFLGVAQDITERRQAEDQIRLLANAMQSARDFISITDPKNRFTFVNRAFLEGYGYSQEEVLGKTPEFLYSARNSPGLCAEVFERTLAGSWEGKILNRRKDGMELPIALSTSQIRDAQGRLLGLIGVGKDIAEQLWVQRQQTALSELAYRLSATIKPGEAAEVILDIAFELFGWDAGFVDLYLPEEDQSLGIFAVDTIGGELKVIPSAGNKARPTSMTRLVLKDGKQLINRSDKTPLPVELQPFGDTEHRSESLMFAPIRSRGSQLGVISIQSHTARAYSPEHLKIFQTLADHCGNTLQRIRGAEALSAAEAKYRSIFERATEGIFRTSPEGRLLAANPALTSIFGYDSPEQFMATITDVGQLYAQADRRAELKRLLETDGFATGFEAENCRKDGRKIWITLNAHVARDAQGDIAYYEGTIQDITERKQALQHLADALKLNETILASSSLGILVYSAAGGCVFANEAAARIFNTTVEKLRKQNFRQLEFWRESGLLALADETLHSRKVRTSEGRWVCALGKEIWLDWRLAAFVSGGELHLLALTDDITDRKQAETELRELPKRIIQATEAERLRVARELHDGVNQIIAAAKVKLRTVQTKIAASSPATGEILSRCNGLLVQALEENRRVAHNLRPSDLDEFGFVAACKNFCKEFRSRTSIKVQSRISEFGPRLPEATELNLFRIVQEAFNNIEKHAKASTVWLRISVQAGALVVRIRDDGHGFNPNLPPNRRKKRPGIGLTNIRERAASAGGTGTVESAPEKGTVVTVRLPLASAP